MSSKRRNILSVLLAGYCSCFLDFLSEEPCFIIYLYYYFIVQTHLKFLEVFCPKYCLLFVSCTSDYFLD